MTDLRLFQIEESLRQVPAYRQDWKHDLAMELLEALKGSQSALSLAMDALHQKAQNCVCGGTQVVRVQMMIQGEPVSGEAECRACVSLRNAVAKLEGEG